MDSPPLQAQDLRSFTVGLIAAQGLGLLCIALVAALTGYYFGGFAWHDNPRLEFNYHPLFMVIGLIFLYGDAILVYRVLRNEKKTTLKLIHAGLHATAFIFTVIALKAVFDMHNLNAPPIPNLYSMHSWLGIITVVLFSMQFALGFLAFLFPGVAYYWRVKYLPVHVFFGICILVMAVATALIGINEKLFFMNDYPTRPVHAYVGNFLGLSLVAWAVLVIYLVSKPEYKRRPLPEEAALQLEPQSPVQ